MDNDNLGRAVGAVIVLAAGGGTRMRSRRSKLLHEVAGESLLSHALRAAFDVHPERVCVVVGHAREQVEAHLAEVAPDATIAVQEQQRGTGDAVRAGLAALGGVESEVVVTYGDVPMLTGDTLRALVAEHRREGAGVTVLTALVDDPTGYGRVVRGVDDTVERIVEQRDATETERAIREINSGIYVFDPAVLADGLARITDDNDQHELYLTDVLGLARADGRRVVAHVTADTWQTEGVNDRVQLARMGKEMNRRACERWMREGVTIMDPDTTWIESSVELAPDVTLLPNTMLRGATTVAEGATIGPDVTLIDCEVGADAVVVRAHGVLAVIGEEANVGPYVSMRAGTVLARGAKLGTFVETKNAQVGEGAKVPHLCYAGDARIDAGANIGAGTIFANYDGVNKSITHVGRNSFVGSNSVLVAPVDIADGSYVAAGSAVAEDVAPGELAIARGRQHNAAGWVAKRHPGSKTHQAAEAAAAYQVHPGVLESRAKINQKAEEHK